jgi:hypothetical protein
MSPDVAATEIESTLTPADAAVSSGQRFLEFLLSRTQAGL